MTGPYCGVNGVDAEVIDVLLPRYVIDHPGYAIDIGANNGTFLSNTLALEQGLGWFVLCVEPNPLLAESGRASRNLWRQVACGSTDAEEAEFCALSPSNGYASNSALLKDGRVTYTDDLSGGQRFMVPVRTVDRLLEEAGFPRLDAIFIDVEGSEKEVLSGFSIERWKPTIMVVESLYYEMEAPPGYRLHKRIQVDNLFVRTE